MVFNPFVSKFIPLFCISYLCLESYIYQCMEACYVQYVDYPFFSFLTLRIHINQRFSDIELLVDAKVVKTSSLLQDYLQVARVCPRLAAYLLASLVECTRS
jgi:hypothetical protein